MPTVVAKWGNSLAVRVPQKLAEELGFREGTAVTLSVSDNVLQIAVAKPRFRLEDLLRDFKPEHRHEETDWGAPKGVEQW